MAVKGKKAKPKKKAISLTLWDVILSYPDVHEPKPYKGEIRYTTDVLMEKGQQALKDIKAAIMEVATETWGDDQSEWPEKIPMPKNGDEREDSQGYAGRRYIKASTQTPIAHAIVDLKGKVFNAQMVKGGMFANVAVTVKAWEFDGDEGISIYLDGIQVDTSKAALNFGGGKSVKQMFSRDGDDEDADDQDDSDDSDDEEDEDEAPPAKKKKKPARDFDDDEEDEVPVKKKSKRVVDEDDEDEAPRKKKKPTRNFDDEDDE